MAAATSRGGPAAEAKAKPSPASGTPNVLSYVREALSGTVTLLQEAPPAVVSETARLMQEVPLVGIVCMTFLSFEKLVDTARSNKEDLAVLRDLFDVVIEGVLERRSDRSGLLESFKALQEHTKRAEKVAKLCNRKVKPASKIPTDIAAVLLGFCIVDELLLITSELYERWRDPKRGDVTIATPETGATTSSGGPASAAGMISAEIAAVRKDVLDFCTVNELVLPSELRVRLPAGRTSRAAARVMGLVDNKRYDAYRDSVKMVLWMLRVLLRSLEACLAWYLHWELAFAFFVFVLYLALDPRLGRMTKSLAQGFRWMRKRAEGILHVQEEETRQEEETQAPVSDFPKGSGVADRTIPVVVAEEADNVPDGTPLRRVTLAKSLLGSDAVVWVSASHGVELELQAGSLVEDVHHDVTVSPRLQIVTCRTEGSGRAPSHETSHDEEFLAMTFVYGPEEASFLDENPAKLRFFVGYVDEFVPEDGSDRVLDNEGIEKYVLETYKPLTSPNGADDWTVLGRYTVHFPPPVLGEREVWVETELHHFCTVANAMKKVAEKGLASTANNESYLYQDVGSSWRRRDKNHPPVPTFCIGNATKNDAVFLYYPIVNITEASKESEGNSKVKASWMGWGIGFGLGTRNQSSSTGGDRSAASEEIPVVLRPGEYTFCDMACGVKEHSQMHIRIGVLKHMTGEGSEAKGKFQLLDVRKIGGNKVLVLQQPCLTKPIMYREIDWPCAAKDIRALSGGRTESDGRRENGFWKLPSPYWIGASLATAVFFYVTIVSFDSPQWCQEI